MFSSVVRHTYIRVLLASTTNLEQINVKTTFAHIRLQEKIYMAQLEGFRVPGGEDKVCLLKQSLYRLKQLPRQWYKRFDVFVLKIDFITSEFDSCVDLRNIE